MPLDDADLDDRARALLEPVKDLLDRALDDLPSAPPLKVRLGDVPGFYRLSGRDLILSEHLQGPALHHPDEPIEVMPPMDRWRRAAGCVLEAAALQGLGRRFRRRPGTDWRWLGAAIDLVDAVAPELELSQPDVAMAIHLGEPGRHARSGVVVYKHARACEAEVMERASYLLTGGVISPIEWAEIGAWVMDPLGAGRLLPVVVKHAPASDVPAAVVPWSWKPIEVPAHPRGGLVRVDGSGHVREPWARGDRVLRTLAGATSEGCTLEANSGGPVGEWALASAEGFGQVFGARGVTFTFDDSGRLQVVLADAFVGPLAAVAMAEEVGTSGVADGRWRVEGRYLLGFDGIVPQGLTMHGRGGAGFMVPAVGFGLGEWLQALEESPWAWQATEDRLVMRGRMMGGEVEVRLKGMAAPV